MSDWLTLTQGMIDAFAEVTGDRQWIHIDPQRCQRELGTSTIAHGYLVLSLLAQFSYQAYSVAGISHNPLESSTSNDFDLAARAMMALLDDLARDESR